MRYVLTIPLLSAYCDEKGVVGNLTENDPEIEWKFVFEDEFERMGNGRAITEPRLSINRFT